jgi:hypothetical protein
MDDDDSIAGRAQKLRQDMELLLQEEWRFRRSRTHSLADNNEHDKRKARLVAIREELRILVEKANRQASQGSVWYS